ncbi:hypothetical protein P3S72_19375 [Pseudomonas sp. D3]|uniref:hypothetical protein n=1 Tax=Pseudomonas sp. D3 TaxID=517398 RepID=UPI0023E42A88|nr:hypothetical protein [Pseudomonas sp. D3]WET08657.1 hypothetical protein P3S72_19375 [Pseudomonas sp. D3]
MDFLAIWEGFLCWVELHPGLASWVQAFGAIAAILVAMLIASSQARNQIKREKEDASQRSLAQAGRLYLIAKEYCDTLLNVVEPAQEDNSGLADQIVSVAFSRIINRLNANFDDDLNPARNVQIHILRASLTSIIFILENGRHIDPYERISEIVKLRELAPDLVESCKALLESKH